MNKFKYMCRFNGDCKSFETFNLRIYLIIQNYNFVS